MLIGDYKLSLAIKQNPKRLTGKEYVAGLIEDAVQYDKANPDEYPRTPIICTQDGLLDAEDYLIRDWTVQIGIYEGYWFSTFGGDGCGVSIFIPRGDFIFEFSFTEWRENPNFFDTLRNYKIARRIADTLKFLD